MSTILFAERYWNVYANMMFLEIRLYSHHPTQSFYATQGIRGYHYHVSHDVMSWNEHGVIYGELYMLEHEGELNKDNHIFVDGHTVNLYTPIKLKELILQTLGEEEICELTHDVLSTKYNDATKQSARAILGYLSAIKGAV